MWIALEERTISSRPTTESFILCYQPIQSP
jgi:hypothetical protein